jgi:hypothetical protein
MFYDAFLLQFVCFLFHDTSCVTKYVQECISPVSEEYKPITVYLNYVTVFMEYVIFKTYAKQDGTGLSVTKVHVL